MLDDSVLVAIKTWSEQATIFKAITVSCTTFHLYYSVLHLDEEVAYIWCKRWTAGKVVYLLTRYLGSVFLILASLGIANIGWDTGTILLQYLQLGGSKMGGIKGYLFDSCLSGRLYTGMGTMIMLLAEVILMMRVYALFGATRKLLFIFIMLTLLLIGFNILQLTFDLNYLDIGYSLAEIDVIRHTTVITTFGCLNSRPVSGSAWVVTSFIELLLFLPVLWKSLQTRKTKPPMCFSKRHGSPQKAQDIVTLMARDSIVYFVVIILSCLFPTILAFISARSAKSGAHLSYSAVVFFGVVDLGSNNSYQTIVITIMTILAPKMLINLRAEYYGPVGIIATELSSDVQFAERSGMQTIDEV